MTNINRFTPLIPTKPAENQNQKIQQDPQNEKAQDTQVKTGALSDAMKLQPNARVLQAKLLKTIQKKTAKENIPQTEDPIAQAATAGTFNPFINALKDSTVIGFGGLTYGEERKLFAGISVGMQSLEELATAAQQFMLKHFVPSRSVGF